MTKVKGAKGYTKNCMLLKKIPEFVEVIQYVSFNIIFIRRQNQRKSLPFFSSGTLASHHITDISQFGLVSAVN